MKNFPQQSYPGMRRKRPSSDIVMLRVPLAIVLVSISITAYANAFIPTMISAHVVWLFALVPVVIIEGWLMARWKWANPYRTSLQCNLLSMLAALPFGVILSLAGSYLASKAGKSTFAFLPDSTRFFITQILFYGDAPAPAYGFITTLNGAGIFLAAILFIGLCWLLTFVIEGYYYWRKNPSHSKQEIFRGAALANIVSYCFLISLWLPYSYHSARSAEKFTRDICAKSSSWSSDCPVIMDKFPEIKEQRLTACRIRKISEARCFPGRE